MGTENRLDVNYDELADALIVIQDAVESFRVTNESAFEADRTNMEPMNSDFIEIFARILECFPKWKSKDLLENLDTFCKDAQTIMDDLAATDEGHNESRLEEDHG